MPLIAERSLAIVGTDVVGEAVAGLEIDGTVFVEYGPDAVAGQDLIGLVAGLVGKL